MDEEKTITLRIAGSEFGFVLPYIQAEIPDAALTDNADAQYTCVLSAAADADAASKAYPEAAVIALPQWVIGTGMTGLPRELAARVWRGTFFREPASDPAISAIHATDVARAVRLTLGEKGIFIVTDGRTHTLDELADALAWRMGQKRVLTAPARWARWLPGHSFRRRCTELPQVDGSQFIASHNFHPANVAEYLKTHVYDDTSL